MVIHACKHRYSYQAVAEYGARVVKHIDRYYREREGEREGERERERREGEGVREEEEEEGEGERKRGRVCQLVCTDWRCVT